MDYLGVQCYFWINWNAATEKKTKEQKQNFQRNSIWKIAIEENIYM